MNNVAASAIPSSAGGQNGLKNQVVLEARGIPSAYSRLVPDVARLSALGWTAQIDPPAGFRRMIEAYTA